MPRRAGGTPVRGPRGPSKRLATADWGERCGSGRLRVVEKYQPACVHLIVHDTELPAGPATAAREAYRAFSTAVDRMRDGEQVVALINPQSETVDRQASSTWLSSRLLIGELQRRFLPRCDQRCLKVPHDPHAFVVMADLVLDPTEPRRMSWWESWTDTLQRAQRRQDVWYAGAPAMPDSPRDQCLATGTRLTRLTATDPYWVHYDTVEQEVLYRIDDGPLAGDALIAASFGLSPLLPGLAGAMIGPDHPPVRDPVHAVRMLSAGWAAVERGLPAEA